MNAKFNALLPENQYKPSKNRTVAFFAAFVSGNWERVLILVSTRLAGGNYQTLFPWESTHHLIVFQGGEFRLPAEGYERRLVLCGPVVPHRHNDHKWWLVIRGWKS